MGRAGRKERGVPQEAPHLPLSPLCAGLEVRLRPPVRFRQWTTLFQMQACTRTSGLNVRTFTLNFPFVCRSTVSTERSGHRCSRCWAKRHFILEYSSSGSRGNKHHRHRPKYNQGLCKTENRAIWSLPEQLAVFCMLINGHCCKTESRPQRQPVRAQLYSRQGIYVQQRHQSPVCRCFIRKLDQSRKWIAGVW